MSQNIYYIIGGIAVVFIIYLIFLQTMMKKRKEKQLEKFNENHSGATLTEAQKRVLAFGAILSYFRGEKLLDIKPNKNLDQYAYGLREQWEISNPEEAKETLDNLLQLKRSSEFESFLLQPSAELSQIQKDIVKGLGIERAAAEQVKSAYAWDVCRAVSLAKWCYWCGYLNEEETWSTMERAAETAKQHGNSWTDYTVSFLLGRTIQGFDLEDIIVESKQILTGQGPSLRKIEDIDVYSRYAF